MAHPRMESDQGETEKRQLSSPNYQRLIVKGGTCGEGSGSAALWWPASHPPLPPPTPTSLWCPVSTTHTSEDNMAATDRNLLLELRIKATEPDRNLLSNIHTVGGNKKTQAHTRAHLRKCELLCVFIHCGRRPQNAFAFAVNAIRSQRQ